MKRQLKLGALCLALVFCFAGTKVSASSADIMDFYFTIYQGNYKPAQYYDANPNSSVSYKYYKGTNKLDRSAYVINTANTQTPNINFYQYLGNPKNSNTKYSSTLLHYGRGRTTYINKAPADTSYGHVFFGSRENPLDGKAVLTGSWSSDDKTK